MYVYMFLLSSNPNKHAVHISTFIYLIARDIDWFRSPVVHGSQVEVVPLLLLLGHLVLQVLVHSLSHGLHLSGKALHGVGDVLQSLEEEFWMS